MGPRWIEKEMVALEEVKRRLHKEISSRPQYPDVVGDRRIIRFLRGKQNNVEETVKMFSGFLKWRDENDVDNIRNQILFGGLDTPFKFPNGKKIIDLAPQIIISAKAKDFKGQPLVLEQYCFSPSEMFVRVTIQDYLLFLVYALEYRALVMEQMSHEEEMRYIEKYPNPDDRETGYGVVLLNFCIRDLNGVGVGHLTGKGKQIIEAAIKIGLPNYPEYLGKCHMVNVPWLFTSMWFFIKGLLDDFILAKINLTGTKFIDVLLNDMPIESIPKALGGKFELYNESYAFDVSEAGPFHLAGDAAARHPHIDFDHVNHEMQKENMSEMEDSASQLDAGDAHNNAHNERPYKLQGTASTSSFISTDSEQSHPTSSSDENTSRLVPSRNTASLTRGHHSANALDKLTQTQLHTDGKSSNSNKKDAIQEISFKKSVTMESGIASRSHTMHSTHTTQNNYNHYSAGPSFVLHAVNSTTLPVCPKTLAPQHTTSTHITPTPLKQKTASARQPSHTSVTSSLSDLRDDHEIRTRPYSVQSHVRETSTTHSAHHTSSALPKHTHSKHASHRSATLSVASSGVSTFQAMQQHASSFSEADFGASSKKSAVDSSNKTTVTISLPGRILDYVTSPVYVGGALVVLLISLANPTFAFRYLLIPFLFALFFVYVL